MHCETCEDLGRQYKDAVHALNLANQHLRQAKLGTLQSALSRREVHDSLNALIAAETETKAHKAWHIECLTAVPHQPCAAI